MAETKAERAACPSHETTYCVPVTAAEADAINADCVDDASLSELSAGECQWCGRDMLPELGEGWEAAHVGAAANARRASDGRALARLLASQHENGDALDDLTDGLASLLHAGRVTPADMERAARRAVMHFEAEKGGAS